MGYELDDTHKRALAAERSEPQELKPWSYSAIAASIVAMCVPAWLAYLVFPVALALAVVAVSKGSRLARWAAVPLALTAAGLIYTSFVITQALN